MAKPRRAVNGGRIARSLRPATLAGRTVVRWAGTYASFGARRTAAREQFALRTAEDVRRTMGEMKGAIMKFGQILSLMTGVMPDDMLEELAVLQADAPPMAYSLVQEVFDEQYGRSPQKVFRKFEKEPFAAASIGQVHRAVLHDGTPAAVKVQYPGVREAIEHDLANVAMMITIGAKFSQGLEAGPIVRDLKEGILGELDYLREAQWQQRFRERFEGHAFIYVPRVFHELTTSRVIVQEYVNGKPFSAALLLDQAGRNRIGEIIFRYAFGSIYRHGLFNGDPHPGQLPAARRRLGGVRRLRLRGRVFARDDRRLRPRATRVVRGRPRSVARVARRERNLARGRAVHDGRVVRAHALVLGAAVARGLAFSPQLASEMIRHNTQTTGQGGKINEFCNVPEGQVFLTRINFGLAGVLANLRAEGPWRGIVREWVEGDPPSTELGLQSARTTRTGAAV